MEISELGGRAGLRDYLDGYAGSFIAAQTQAIVAQADFHGISQGGETQDFDLFSLEQAHFQETLNQSVLTLDGLHAKTLAEPSLVQGKHGKFLTLLTPILHTDRPNQDLHGFIPAQTQARFADLQEARTAWLKNAQSAAGANPQFRHAPHPARLSGHFGHIRPFANP
jgi:hypothetical protein